jgi:hypothetical protein
MKALEGISAKRWTLASAALVAATVPLGIVLTLGLQAVVTRMRQEQAAMDPASAYIKGIHDSISALQWNIGVGWVAVGVGAVGTVLLVLLILGRPASEWLKVSAVAAMVYLVLSGTPRAMTGDVMPIVLMVLAAAALGVFMPVILKLQSRHHYGLCCGAMGIAAVFFYQWEPPPPKPLQIAKPLTALPESLLARLNSPLENIVAGRPWTAQAKRLDDATEKKLGVDEYLQLLLEPNRSNYRVVVFVTYKANARTMVEHVPWVCMPEQGFVVKDIRQDEMAIRTVPGREFSPNVVVVQKGEGPTRQRALVFHYFNVGGTYTWSRSEAKSLGTRGAFGGEGNYISQTQIIVWIPPQDNEDPSSKNSNAYQTAYGFLNLLVPLLEHDHYPDLRAGTGG